MNAGTRMHHVLGAAASHLALALGLLSCSLSRSLPAQPSELQCTALLAHPALTGGLQVLQPPNPYEEDKGEARSPGSTAGSTPSGPAPSQPSHQSPPAPSLTASLADAKLNVESPAGWLWVALCRCGRGRGGAGGAAQPPEHPAEELARALAAALIHHLALQAPALRAATLGELLA